MINARDILKKDMLFSMLLNDDQDKLIKMIEDTCKEKDIKLHTVTLTECMSRHPLQPTISFNINGYINRSMEFKAHYKEILI